MATPATGELRKLANGFEARIRIDGKNRKGFDLTGVAGEEAARERCKAMAEIATRLRKAGHADKAAKILEAAGKTRPGRPWEQVLVAVNALCTDGGAVSLGAAAITWAELGDEWTSGRLATKHTDHVKRKKNVASDKRIARMYVNPKIGPFAVQDARLEDFELVMADLPARLKPASRRHVAQYMAKLASLAVYPCRLLQASPIPRGWLPKIGGRLAMQYLRPDEDRRLLECVDVPLVRRLFFGVLAREGLRREELAGLLWRDLSLDVGAITLDTNKTNDPRSWALHPGVVRALTAWRDRYRPDPPPDERVFLDPNGIELSTKRMAHDLRADLKRAGVTRAELFARTEARIPMRVHDLRATACTVWLANGKSEAWCCDRTGHRSSTMLNRYRRSARSWAELGLGELLSLDDAIPELSKVSADPGPSPPVPQRVPQICTRPLGGMAYAGDLKGGMPFCDSREAAKIGSDEVPRSPETTHVGALPGHSSGQSFQVGNAEVASADGGSRTQKASSFHEEHGKNAVRSMEDLEAAIAFAITEASKAGQWTVVAQLAKELEARRLARSENVVSLDPAKRRR